MKRKGFTLVELLVVIAIIALLMGILMPALARVRSIAYRLVCGTNLSGIGKAMVLYANDYEEDYPVAGPRDVYWGSTGDIAIWDSDDDVATAIGTNGGTVTSCFFLLVKWYDLPPKQFICRGDLGTETFAFNVSGDPTRPSNSELELEDVWDFGMVGTSPDTQPGKYCSYSYHYPFPIYGYPISIASRPSAPLCADRNPWLDKSATSNLTEDKMKVAYAIWRNEKYMDIDNRENSASHSFDGQNVLYNDIHVNFEKHPNIGIQQDNIWKRWPNKPPPSADDKERQLTGDVPTQIGATSETDGNQDQKDAYLINEVQKADWIFTAD